MRFKASCTILIGLAVGVWTAQSASGQCPCEGDVNDDGVVNVIDIIRVFECATGVIPPNDPACAG